MSDRDAPNPLIHVQRGMMVYDANGDEIGVVEHVHVGSNATPNINATSSPASAETDIGIEGEPLLIESAFPAILNPENLPSDLVERMLADGYLQVARAGLAEIGSIILPDQIDSVSEEGIHLIP